MSPAIPAVYEEFQPRNSTETYSFQEEDLEGYAPLYDRANAVGPRAVLDSLNTTQRVDVIEKVRRALAAAHNKDHTHGDLQLDNILVKVSKKKDVLSADIKLTDWATSKSGASNMFRDVQQAAGVFKQVLEGSSEIPIRIDQWIQDVEKNIFTNSSDAWNKLKDAILFYILEEEKSDSI